MKEAQKQKQLIIDEIKDKFERAESAVVIDYIGITVAQADAMRKKLREANVDYTVYKNTLVKRAIAGTEYEALGEVLEGPSGFAFSYDDATAPARILAKFAKDANETLYLINCPNCDDDSFQVTKAGMYYSINAKPLFDSLGYDYKSENIMFDLVREKHDAYEIYKLIKRAKPRKN